MKILICLFGLLLTLTVQGQSDTLYAHDQKTVALFFPEPIVRGITGAAHFIFSYNQELEQHYGLLQAEPGAESNLLVLTKDGSVYSYILRYHKAVDRLFYFIEKEARVGVERPILPVLTLPKMTLDSLAAQKAYFKQFSKYLLGTPPKHLKTKRKRGIKLELQQLVYHQSELYVVLEIINRSKIRLDIERLDLYRVSGQKRRKASFQRQELIPLECYSRVEQVKPSQATRMVYVLPKFVLGDKERLQLELQEEKGGRKVVLFYR